MDRLNSIILVPFTHCFPFPPIKGVTDKMKSMNEVHKMKSMPSLWPLHTTRRSFHQRRPCSVHRSSSEVRQPFSCEAASASSRSLLVLRAVGVANNCVVSNGADGKFSPSLLIAGVKIRIHLENISLARIFQAMDGGGR